MAAWASHSIKLQEGQAIRLFMRNANTYLRLELERAQRITGPFNTIREHVVYCRNLHHDYMSNHKTHITKKNTVNFLTPHSDQDEEPYPLKMISPMGSTTNSSPDLPVLNMSVCTEYQDHLDPDPPLIVPYLE